MNPLRWISAVALPTLLVLAGAAVGQDVPFDTVRGTILVQNSPTGSWSAGDGWSWEETLRIGSVSGDAEAEFGGGQLSIGTNEEGDILVLDHQARQIRVFDRTGRFIRSLGRPGAGPGEFDAPMGMVRDQLGRMWVPEAFNGRYTVFDETGEFLRTVPRPMRSYNRLRRLYFDDAGNLIDHAATGGAGFFRVDTLGTIRDTFPPLRFPPLPGSLEGRPLPRSPDDPVRQAVYARLLPRLLWAMAPDRTLWFGHTDELRLIQRTLSGDTIRIVRTAHRTGRFSSAEVSLVRRAERQLGESDVFSPQVMQSINVLEDGHVLVQIAEEMGQPGRLFDVFDPEGVFLGTMEAPFRMPPRTVPASRGDTLIVVDRDELDVPFVVRMAIHR